MTSNMHMTERKECGVYIHKRTINTWLLLKLCRTRYLYRVLVVGTLNLRYVPKIFFLKNRYLLET